MGIGMRVGQGHGQTGDGDRRLSGWEMKGHGTMDEGDGDEGIRVGWAGSW